MSEIKENKESGDPRVKLLQRAFVNKASRMYELEKRRFSDGFEKLSELNLARRYLGLLSSSRLVIIDEKGMHAWEYEDYSTRYDSEGTPKGLFVKGQIIGSFTEKEKKNAVFTSLDKFEEGLTLNSNIMIEEISDPSEREMFSTMLTGLAEIERGM